MKKLINKIKKWFRKKKAKRGDRKMWLDTFKQWNDVLGEDKSSLVQIEMSPNVMNLLSRYIERDDETGYFDIFSIPVYLSTGCNLIRLTFRDGSKMTYFKFEDAWYVIDEEMLEKASKRYMEEVPDPNQFFPTPFNSQYNHWLYEQVSGAWTPQQVAFFKSEDEK